MRNLQFNFNNEVDTFMVQQNEETGEVTVPGENGEVLATYDSMQQLAEIYAQARDVKPENLKNWTLVEHGDVVSFVLRAGTAGVSAAEVEGQLAEVLDALAAEGNFHPLHVARIRQEVRGAADVTAALAMSEASEVAREVYDRLDAMGAFTEPEPEVEEVDDRSELEKYLDMVMEADKTLAFFANLMGLKKDAGKEAILQAFDVSTIPYTVEMLRSLYNDALEAAMGGINVGTRFDAILVVTQSVPGERNEDAKNRLMQAARLAGRRKVNVTSYVVGQHHIRKTATLVQLDELDAMDVYMVDNTLLAVVFDPDVDAALIEEQQADDEDEGSGPESVSGHDVRVMLRDHQEAEDEYGDDDYEDDEDGDDGYDW